MYSYWGCDARDKCTAYSGTYVYLFVRVQRVIAWLPSHTRYYGYGRATLLGNLCGM